MTFLILLRALLSKHPYLTLWLPGGCESGRLNVVVHGETEWWYVEPKNGRKRHYFDPMSVSRLTVHQSEEERQ